jgi:ribonuclease R
VPEDRKLPWDVFVAPGGGGIARDGDLVVTRITDWGGEHRGPTGAIEEVLGRYGDPGVDVMAIIRGHELATDFPADVEQAAEALRARGVTEADLAGREDLRPLHVFTIDPADARDHDDALSIEAIGSGWRVGVHIADVSHYVAEHSALDREAARRGTSVYLVDRVIPMLPHAISTDICSLVPDTDRLTLSLLVDLAADGSVRGHSLVRGVIRSRRKVSYEEAQAVLDGSASLDDGTDDALRRLSEVAGLLRREREQRGSLDFDLPETRVVLDLSGEPTDVQRVVRLEAHRLVEDFMLLANEVIARRAARSELPFLFRIHESPDASRMAQLREFVATFGHRLTGRGGEPTPATCSGCCAQPRASRRGPGFDRGTPLHEAGPLQRAEPRSLRPRDSHVHAFHVAHPPIPRPRGAPRHRRRLHRRVRSPGWTPSRWPPSPARPASGSASPSPPNATART